MKTRNIAFSAIVLAMCGTWTTCAGASVQSVGVTSACTMQFDAAADVDGTSKQAWLHYSATVHEQSEIASNGVPRAGRHPSTTRQQREESRN